MLTLCSGWRWSDLCIMFAAGSIPVLGVELGGRFCVRVAILDKKRGVLNRIASPRKQSDWLWHVVDAKVRAWIRFILSVHTPPNHPSTSNTKHIPTYAPHHLPPMNFSCLKGQAEGDMVLLAYQWQFTVQKVVVLACDLRWTILRLKSCLGNKNQGAVQVFPNF